MQERLEYRDWGRCVGCGAPLEWLVEIDLSTRTTRLQYVRSRSEEANDRCPRCARRVTDQALAQVPRLPPDLTCPACGSRDWGHVFGISGDPPGRSRTTSTLVLQSPCGEVAIIRPGAAPAFERWGGSGETGAGPLRFL